MKNFIKKVPFLNAVFSYLYYKAFMKIKTFSGSKHYWLRRYSEGGTSGAGSYNKLAKFKAKIINEFVADQEIKKVLEFGCGDGNQLKYANYPSYVGVDISHDAIKMCEDKYNLDLTKKFVLLSEANNEKADLTMSLDVIYHLIEDSVFDAHMESLFSASEKFVIIYSSNTDHQYKIQAPHVKHRKFTDWVSSKNNWQQINFIANEHPYNINEEKGSFSDFYIFKNKLLQ